MRTLAPLAAAPAGADYRRLPKKVDRFTLGGGERAGHGGLHTLWVMARTHASFDADDDSFPTDGEPAGHELADYVHASLHNAGFDPGEPEEHEGWAWDVAERNRYSIVGLTDDPPVKWQIHTYGKDVGAWCEAVHAALAAHAGVRDLRWFEPAEDDDWADSPG